jgi:hypothetical protein
MTMDEWCARGVELALLAEDAAEVEEKEFSASLPPYSSSTAGMYLRKAIQCFTRAGNAALRARAEAQLDARSELHHLFLSTLRSEEDPDKHPPEPMSLPEEVAAASIFLRCLRTGLWFEAGKLSEALCRLLEASGHFDRNVHRLLKEKCSCSCLQVP